MAFNFHALRPTDLHISKKRFLNTERDVLTHSAPPKSNIRFDFIYFRRGKPSCVSDFTLGPAQVYSENMSVGYTCVVAKSSLYTTPGFIYDIIGDLIPTEEETTRGKYEEVPNSLTLSIYLSCLLHKTMKKGRRKGRKSRKWR